MDMRKNLNHLFDSNVGDSVKKNYEIFKAEKLIAVFDPDNKVRFHKTMFRGVKWGWSYESNKELDMFLVHKDDISLRRANGLLMEFPNDDSAKLWFKLEYGE
jgi:hypothetical protein